MSACQNSIVSASVDNALLSGNTIRVGLEAIVFVISRSAVQIRTVAFLSPQQDNISLFVSFGQSQLAIAGFAHSSRFLDGNAKKNIDESRAKTGPGLLAGAIYGGK